MRILIIFAMSCLLTLGWQQGLQAQFPFGVDKIKQSTGESSVPNITMTGRFQMYVSPNIKNSTFMLDTDTGRVWIVKKDHTSGNYYLKRVPVDEIDNTASSTKSDKSPSKGLKPKDSASKGGKE